MSNNWTYSSMLCFFKKLSEGFHWVKLCEEHGYTYHWISGQNPHLIKDGTRIDCKKIKLLSVSQLASKISLIRLEMAVF